DIYNYIMDNQAQAAMIILGLYALKSVTVVIYYSFLVAVSGFVFDLPLAILINSAGTLICLTVSYFIGYFTKSDSITEKLDKHPKIKRYFDKCETNSFLVSYILHALGLSTEVLGLMFGFIKMPYFKYVLSSFLAIAPGMICVTIFGGELDFTSWEFWLAAAVEVTVIITAYMYSKKKLLRRSN
ncbi:MAG: VTT domain-containing protein, partial [Clostridiales bacterium]|nr:VTT domain-containing protein [Clostridiales bacterium]